MGRSHQIDKESSLKPGWSQAVMAAHHDNCQCRATGAEPILRDQTLLLALASILLAPGKTREEEHALCCIPGEGLRCLLRACQDAKAVSPCSPSHSRT